MGQLDGHKDECQYEIYTQERETEVETLRLQDLPYTTLPVSYRLLIFFSYNCDCIYCLYCAFVVVVVVVSVVVQAGIIGYGFPWRWCSSPTHWPLDLIVGAETS